MKKIIASTLVAALTATAALAPAVPAQAQSSSFSFSFGQGNQVIDRYCRTHRDNDCNDYRRGHSHWSRNDYNRFYTRHRGGLDSLAAGIFGFTFGSIIAGAVANSRNNDDDFRVSSGHVARCEARFRSYDEASDTYLGYDGRRHDCLL